ncbi:Acetoin utilization protein AcuC [Candidatus Entotheonellaceae bacterium PAL068K]
MFVTYHPDYVIDIGVGHRFPMQKYGLVYERLVQEGTLGQGRIVQPPPVAVNDLFLVHSRDYVERFLAGHMSPKELRRLGFSWSPQLVRRACLAVQGTIIASQLALQHGLAANLAGGSHHAFADHGEGFSVFNDMAIAIRVLQRDQGVQRAAIIDCDVHQGNGTATIFAADPSVFTCSLHGEKNYPFCKASSDLDVPLPDHTDDTAYLRALQTHLPTVLSHFRPDMVWYLAGVDPYVGDTLGRLALSLPGLQQRDTYVIATCCRAGVPVVITLGGGYAAEVNHMVEAHCNTIRVAFQCSTSDLAVLR